MPWISAASAVGAGFAVGDRRAGRALRATALAALALYAYFRWIAPAATPMGLTCQALGQAVLPLGAPRWRRVAIALPAAGWLILANLYHGAGDGIGVFVGDGLKAALLAALLIGGGYGLWRVWRRTPRPHVGLVLEAGALAVMATATLTLDWDFWPVIAGALAVLAAFALTLYGAGRPGAEASSNLQRGAWALTFLGQAAMAYAFLR